VELMFERCAGVDIGKDEVVACVRTPGREGKDEPSRPARSRRSPRRWRRWPTGSSRRG
jgi:hypothetical protein